MAVTEADAETLTEQAYRRLEEMIVTLELPPGSILSEVTLSQRLAIGRTPIREALQRLARDRLVRILPRRGVLVTTVDVREQLKLLEMRSALDQLTARCAARRASAEERQRFQALAVAMERAADEGDDRIFLRADQEFNALFATAARNEYLVATLDWLQPVSRRFWYAHYRQFADMPQTARLHADVMRAIAAGEPEAAASAARRLVAYLVGFAQTVLAEG